MAEKVAENNIPAEIVPTESMRDGDIKRVYEVGYHIISDIKEEDIEGVVATIRSLIKKNGGSFVAEAAPILMRLAYEMPQHKSGKNINHDRAYFGWIKFEAPSEAVNTISETLNADPVILRSIVFKTIREDTRAKIKSAGLREVRRTDAIKSSPRQEEPALVSEVDLDKAIEGITAE